MNPTPVITKHAIERHQQRVDRWASAREAALEISHIIDRAVASSRARRWSRVVAQPPARGTCTRLSGLVCTGW